MIQCFKSLDDVTPSRVRLSTLHARAYTHAYTHARTHTVCVCVSPSPGLSLTGLHVVPGPSDTIELGQDKQMCSGGRWTIQYTWTVKGYIYIEIYLASHATLGKAVGGERGRGMARAPA